MKINSRRWLDITFFLALFAAGVFQSLHFDHRMDRAMSARKNTNDVWFDADIVRVVDLESNRGGRQTRSETHPLFSLAAYPPVFVIRKALNVLPRVAVRIFHSAIAGLWIGFIFLLLRRLGCKFTESVIFTMVAATSAAATFWLCVPETYALGSITLMVPVFLASQENPPSLILQVLAHIAGLGITVTNWMSAALLTIVSETRRRALIVFASAIAAVVAICFLQRAIFPSARLPLEKATSTAAPFFFLAEAGGFFSCARSFLFHGMIAPGISWWPNYLMPEFPLITFQASPLFSGPAVGWAATVVWAGLLGTGVAVLFKRKDPDKVGMVLGMTLLAQFTLHAMFGQETFLYSLHFVPLLVIMAALATRTRARLVVVALAALLVPLNVANNNRQMKWCTDYTRRFDYLREQLRQHPIDEEESRARIGISVNARRDRKTKSK